MRTRWLLIATAVTLGLLGFAWTFLPQELLAAAGQQPTGPVVMLAQLAGALYLAMAILAWLSRGQRVGGIYARPLALANALHFFAGAMTLLRALAAGSPGSLELALAVPYVVLAVWWGTTLFTSPV